MTDPSKTQFYSAVQDFRRARRQADLERVLARLTGQSADLLSYEEVRRKLKATIGSDKPQLKEIPLDGIVGSVGRYTDFTRSFLPKQDSDESRWAGVKAAASGLVGLPPIRVYQIGDAYFVLDGNHRVSVARQLDATSIEAYVVEIKAKVPLSPDVQPDDLILKAEYADFLEQTHLDELRPEADLSVTIPGQYCALEEHIQVHRYLMGLEQQREISYQEAAAHWYDHVYWPVVQIICERGLMRDFPERTETDMYLWIAEHRAALKKELGWEVEPEAAAADLAAQAGARPRRVVARILDAVTPDELSAGPPPGEWRAKRGSARRDDRLFADVLVAINGESGGWCALEQALEVARREEARLIGLHVLGTASDQEAEAAQAVQAEFQRRCEAAGVPGHLTFASGKVPRAVCERARWTDLAVVSLTYPPPPQPLARLGSGFRALLQRCPQPVLAVPDVSPLSRALLAYDGSPKAEEALFVAAYLAGRWTIPLAVVSVAENGNVMPETLTRAESYLAEHGIQATPIEKSGSAADAILETAQEQGSDLIVMGGYGHKPVLEVVLGSAVDQVLRESQVPTLICR
ncbi:MAG TPA: universal stress protein [Chloroflexi bacterium]|nr:universal stress protein [Chloroflexota bacterium]